ncbi:MAG: hypothetical protein ACE5RH_00925 [Nitrosarchaeum sp.]
MFGNPERKFYFFLARELGKTVDEMLSQMPSSEITEWQAFYSIESKQGQAPRQQKEMLNKLAGKQGRRSRI